MYKKTQKTNKNKKKTKKPSITKVIEVAKKPVDTQTPSEKLVESKHSYLELPLSEIKLDLIGMFLFAVLSIVLVIVLKKYDVSLPMILGFFKK